MANYRSRRYRGAKSETQASTGVADICDVTISSISTDQVLCYNGTNWVNGTVSGGGGASAIGDLTDAVYDADYNIGIGNGAIDSITSGGTYNIGISKDAGTNITTGDNNIAIGYQSLQSNVTGSNNLAIGYHALLNNTASNNLAIGYESLKSVTSGTQNTFVGRGSGQDITTSVQNTGFGYNALANTTASENTAVGHNSALFLTTGGNNVAIGRASLQNERTGSFNTSVGSYALSTQNGGSMNTAVGRASGDTVTTGSNLTMLGYDAEPSSATATNEVTIGNTSVTSLRIPGLQSSATDGDVLTFCSADGNIVLKAASGGGGSISCFSYNNGSSALVATADLTSTCSALFGDVLISGNTITPDDSNTVTCLGSDGTLNISGNLSVQGDFLKLPLTDSCSCCCAPTGGCETTSIGAMRYNTSANTIQVHNGSGFTGVGASSLNDLSDGFVDDFTYIDGSVTYYQSSISIGDNALASYSRSGINDEYGGIKGTNIAIGINTLQCMTPSTASSCDTTCNIAIGTNIACSQTRGQSNVLLGHNVFCCSHSDTWICDNVVIGNQASLNLSASCVQYFKNTTVGICANYFNCCGIAGTNWITDNVVIGFKAGFVNKNRGAVIIGTCAGWNTSQNSSNSNNCKQAHVHIGWGAGCCACGSGIITLGAYAGHKLTGNGLHHYSMFIGNQSGNCNTGNLLCNVIIGGQSGSYMCNSCYNTVVGTKILDQDFMLNVGSGCFTGCNNTIIGYDAAPSSKSVSNQITLGNSSITSLRANVTSISSLSDQRDKTNICDLSVGLCFVDELKPVTFDWNRRDGTMSGQKDVGFIAQDLDSLQQKYNIEDHLNIVLKSNPDRLEASPGKLIPILVKAIQELTKKVEELENKIGE